MITRVSLDKELSCLEFRSRSATTQAPQIFERQIHSFVCCSVTAADQPPPARRSPHTLARSWQAQRRLHPRYKAMTARGKPAAVAVTAMTRELAGFVWAEMTS